MGHHDAQKDYTGDIGRGRLFNQDRQVHQGNDGGGDDPVPKQRPGGNRAEAQQQENQQAVGAADQGAHGAVERGGKTVTHIRLHAQDRGDGGIERHAVLPDQIHHKA